MMKNDLAELFTIERFEAAQIDVTRFDHEAHIYVAWLYVQALPRSKAIEQFDAALRRLTAKIGAADKYNAMITWLFMVLIADRAKQDEGWPTFRASNADLFDERPRMRAA